MLELRQVTAAEFEEWVRVESRAYGNRLNADPERLRPHFDLDRSIAVLDDGQIVGGAHSHRQEIFHPRRRVCHCRRGQYCRTAHPPPPGNHDLDDGPPVEGRLRTGRTPGRGLFASESVI